MAGPFGTTKYPNGSYALLYELGEECEIILWRNNLAQAKAAAQRIVDAIDANRREMSYVMRISDCLRESGQLGLTEVAELCKEADAELAALKARLAEAEEILRVVFQPRPGRDSFGEVRARIDAFLSAAKAGCEHINTKDGLGATFCRDCGKAL